MALTPPPKPTPAVPSPLAPPDQAKSGELAITIGISAAAGGKISTGMTRAPQTGDVVCVVSGPTAASLLPVPKNYRGPALLNIVQFEGEALCIATSCLIPLRAVV